MRFLADMGVSMRVVEWLRSSGHDAIHLRDEGLQRLPNGEIFQKAIRERRMLKAAEVILHDEFEQHREGRMAPLLAELATGHISPQTAARRLLAHIGMEVSE